MSRLYRPYIPLSVRVHVAERQFRDLYLTDGYLLPFGKKRTLSNKLATLLGLLSTKFGCEVRELRLDHDPPLGAREKVPERRPKPNHKWFNSFGVPMRYEPDANDPDHLRYRPHGAQHKGSHDIKTRVRGDHGQFSDLALIRRKKRRAKKLQKKRRVWRRATSVVKPVFASGKMQDAPARIYYRKRKWPKRSFPKRNKQ